MLGIDGIIDQMQRNPQGIRFADLCRVCDHFFGRSRQFGTSHRIYKTPWEGDPRINIQNAKGMAKAYQVRQLLKTSPHPGPLPKGEGRLFIERLKHENEKM